MVMRRPRLDLLRQQVQKRVVVPPHQKQLRQHQLDQTITIKIIIHNRGLTTETMMDMIEATEVATTLVLTALQLHKLPHKTIETGKGAAAVQVPKLYLLLPLGHKMVDIITTDHIITTINQITMTLAANPDTTPATTQATVVAATLLQQLILTQKAILAAAAKSISQMSGSRFFSWPSFLNTSILKKHLSDMLTVTLYPDYSKTIPMFDF